METATGAEAAVGAGSLKSNNKINKTPQKIREILLNPRVAGGALRAVAEDWSSCQTGVSCLGGDDLLSLG